MKYIVLEVTDVAPDGTTHKREIPFVFPDSLVHSMVAEGMVRVLRKERPDGRIRQVHPVSAGFLSSIGLASRCHGSSETLKLASRGERDDALLLMYDYTHGIID